MKKDFINASNSVKFWNFMVLVLLIITGIFSIELLVCELFIGSILAIGLALDGDEDSNFWIMLMPTIWFCLLVAGIVLLLVFIYKKVVVRFNNWLDKNI